MTQIARMKTLADSMRGQTEKRARLAKVLDRKVEKLQDSHVEVTKKERKVVFKLPHPPRSGDVPMTVEHVAVRYGSVEVLRDVNFITRRGDRILIVGKNGAGKSSLLRCLAGTQKAQTGVVKFGANVTVGYFAQEHEQLDFSKSVLESSRKRHRGDRGAAPRAARRLRVEGFGGPPDARDVVRWRAGQTGDRDPRRLGRQPAVVGRTDEQLGPRECRGARDHDAPVEGHDRGGESRTAIRGGA
jgi:ATPase subunit of ABC transporter with duplicated ATPase domains